MQPINTNNNKKRKAPPANSTGSSESMSNRQSSLIRPPLTRQDSGFSIASLGDASTTSSNYENTTQVPNRSQEQTPSTEVTAKAEEERQRALSSKETANEAKERASKFSQEYLKNIMEGSAKGDVNVQNRILGSIVAYQQDLINKQKENTDSPQQLKERRKIIEATGHEHLIGYEKELKVFLKMQENTDSPQQRQQPLAQQDPAHHASTQTVSKYITFDSDIKPEDQINILSDAFKVLHNAIDQELKELDTPEVASFPVRTADSSEKNSDSYNSDDDRKPAAKKST